MCRKLTIVMVVAAIVLWLAPRSALGGDTTITTQVFSGGATDAYSSDSSYHLQGTFRLTAIRLSTGGGYALENGFWPYIRSLGPCCIGIRGNVDGDPNEKININDQVYLTDYLFRGGSPPSCWEEGNVNGDQKEQINVSDVTYLVAYLSSGGPPPPACP
jgi:hypothetical protein